MTCAWTECSFLIIIICLHPLSLTLSFHRVHRSCCKSLKSHFLCLRFDDVSFKSRRICDGRIKKSARPGGRSKRSVVNNGGNVFSGKWTWFYDLVRQCKLGTPASLFLLSHFLSPLSCFSSRVCRAIIIKWHLSRKVAKDARKFWSRFWTLGSVLIQGTKVVHIFNCSWQVSFSFLLPYCFNTNSTTFTYCLRLLLGFVNLLFICCCCCCCFAGRE